MEQIHVEVICAQALERCLYAFKDLWVAGVMRVHLRHQEEALPVVSANRLSHQAFGSSAPVHLGRVDKRHTGIEAGSQRGKLIIVLRGALSQKPCAMPNRGMGVPSGSSTVSTKPWLYPFS